MKIVRHYVGDDFSPRLTTLLSIIRQCFLGNHDISNNCYCKRDVRLLAEGKFFLKPIFLLTWPFLISILLSAKDRV